MGAMNTPVTPEERMRKNERKRVSHYIRMYQANPKTFNKGMVNQLESLALQYQIPFKRVVPTAGFGEHALAGGVGLLDSIAFDLIPDSWYSDESTRTTANAAKITGAVAQVVGAVVATALTGGAAAPTVGAALGNVGKAGAGIGTAIRGAQGLGKISAGAKALGGTGLAAAKVVPTALSKLPLGRLTTGSIEAGKRALTPYGAGQGWKWATDRAAKLGRTGEGGTANVLWQARKAIKEGGNLEAVVKGANLSPAQIATLTSQITRKHTGKTGNELIRQLTTGARATDKVAGVSATDLRSIVNQIDLRGNPYITAKRIQKLASDSKVSLTTDQAEKIVASLAQKGATRIKDAIPHLVSMGGTPSAAGVTSGAGGLRSLANMDTAFALGGAGLAGSTLSGMRTPSREELENAEDPYDPYNQFSQTNMG